LLPALDARKTCDRRLAIVYYYLHIRAELAQQRPDDSLGLFEHRTQNVFRLDLLILAPLGQLAAGLDGFLSSKGEFV
jgi:hypothetical protein